jgi:thiol-disulfide isomerase/thioredoxin
MSREVESMLALIDRPVPADWKSSVQKWFTPKAGLNLEKGVVVVLFWEVWCPHCRREMPEWQTRFEAFEKDGLQLAGFTSLSQGATAEEVEAFIDTHGLTFPIGKEDGTLSLASAVRSIPAAVVYRDGTVIFRGPPPFITDALLSEWLSGSGSGKGK